MVAMWIAVSMLQFGLCLDIGEFSENHINLKYKYELKK